MPILYRRLRIFQRSALGFPIELWSGGQRYGSKKREKNRRFFKCFQYLFIFCLFFVGCGPCPPKEVQQLRINLHTDPPTLDPRKGGDMTSAAMHFLLFEGLTRLTPEGYTEPGIAEAIDLSEDRLTYTFHLRPCLWSDGTPITAHDFEYTWKSMLAPSFPCFNAHLLYPIKGAHAAKMGNYPVENVGVQALDHSTLRVELDQPTPYFLELTSFCALHPVQQKICKENPQWANGTGYELISNGPFRLRQRIRQECIILERNPHYWDRKHIQLEEIKISLIENPNTVLQLFERGEIDLMGASYTDIPEDALFSLEEQHLLQSYPIAATSAIAFNLENGPLQNANIRKALSAAIDRELIAKHISCLSFLPAINALHPTLKTHQNPEYYFQKSAKSYFDEGLQELNLTRESFPTLKLFYSNRGLNQKVVQTLQQQWAHRLGIHVELETSESKLYFHRLQNKEFDIGLFVMRCQYHDPMAILERFKYPENPKNYSSWSNSEFAKLLDDQNYAKTDIERQALIQRAETILFDEHPIAPIFHWEFALIQQPYLKNLYISPRGSLCLNWANIHRGS